MHLYFNPDFTASAHAFDTTRKSGHIAESLCDRPITGIELVDPIDAYDLTERTIAAVHDPAYVDAVRTGEPRRLATSQGFSWDEGILTMALAHNAGAVAAVEHALTTGEGATGTLSSGLHHAARDTGLGYCTFNGLAVAAHVAANRGARVLVVDFDAHCGGGTSGLLPTGAHQVDVSVVGFDSYRPGDDRWLRMADPHDHDDAIGEALAHVDSLGSFDVVLYNAGMDPANNGVSVEQLRRRERLVAEHQFGCPVVFTIAGGYTSGMTMDEVVDLHRLTLEAFAIAR